MIDITYIVVFSLLALLFLGCTNEFLTLPSHNAQERLFLAGFFLLPFNNLLIIRLGTVDTRLLGVFWALPLLFAIPRIRTTYRLNRSIILFLFSFVFVNFFSVVVSPNPGTTIKESIQYTYFALVFVYALYVLNSEAALLKLCRVAVISGTLFSLYGLTEYLLGRLLIEKYVFDLFMTNPIPHRADLVSQGTIAGFDIVRAESMNWGPVGTAQILMIYIFTSLGFVDYLKRKKAADKYSLLGVLCVILSILLLLLTFSRAAYLALFGVTVLFFKHLSRASKVRLMFVGGLVIIVVLLNTVFFSRIDEIGTSEESSNALHYTLYLAAINMFVSNPFLGVGAGNFADVAPLYTSPVFLPYLVSTDAHNFVLQVMAELGILGFMSISLLLLVLLKRSIIEFRRRIKIGRTKIFMGGLTYSFVAVSLMALTMNGFEIELFWLSAGLSLAANNIHITTDSKDPE